MLLPPPSTITALFLFRRFPDYPLVEAISQNVVKHPVLPDKPSRGKKPQERQSAKYTEKYADYIDLGRLSGARYEEHQKLGKKAVLFVMTDDTHNCDDVAEYLESHYPDLKDAVLTIHTKNNGEISESSSGKASRSWNCSVSSPTKSTTIAAPTRPLCPYSCSKKAGTCGMHSRLWACGPIPPESNILPEQTLGRGLRKMYRGGIEEYVSVVGTDAFMEFVESIQAEGVELERKAMGEGTKPKAPLVIEIDNENTRKDIDALDIEIPVLTPACTANTRTLAIWISPRWDTRKWLINTSPRKSSGKLSSKT